MEHTNIPYIAYEGAMSRFERINRRLWITIILLIILLVSTNIAWLIYEAQFEYYETSVTQESDTGTNNYIGNDGEISYGETNGNN